MSTLKIPQRIEPVDIAGRYEHIRPVPQQPNFAARIEGVDLTRPIAPEDASSIARCWISKCSSSRRKS